MDLASLRAQQIELASSVIREDRLDTDPPRYIGGADVGFEQGGEVTRAAMVVLKYPSLELVEYKVARIATTMPYIPGFLSFREYPALLAAWEQLSQKPDLLFVDGHGISHPRRLGVASHFGLLVDVPTIGVAKNACAARLSRSLPNRAHWRRLFIKASSWRGSGAVKRAATRCLSPPGIGSAWTAPRRGCNAV